MKAFGELQRVRDSCTWERFPVDHDFCAQVAKAMRAADRAGGTPKDQDHHKIHGTKPDDIWRQLCRTTVEGDYYADSTLYSNRKAERVTLRRVRCRSALAEAPMHDRPKGQRYRWSIERLGPFHGRGGYDWNTVSQWWDVAGLRHAIVARPVHVLGGLIGPVVRRDSTGQKHFVVVRSSGSSFPA